MSTSAGYHTDRNVDRETACWKTTAGGETVFTGTIRHDDSLPAPGWLLFDQNQFLVDTTQAGFEFVSCEQCCDQIIAEGCWSDGTDNGQWVSLLSAAGTVTLRDALTGNTVDPADVVSCAATQTETTQITVPSGIANIPNASDLTAWEVRHRSGTVTVQVNGGAIHTLDSDEVIGASAQPGSTLTDNVVVNATGGSARIIFTQRDA